MVKLSSLIKDAPAIQIDTLMENSKQKCLNGMFFAMEGLVNDGHDYIDEAIENGAVCIVYSKQLSELKGDIVYIQVEDTFEALKQVANIFYDYPGDKLKTIGVTGTNGKSTVAYLIKSILDNFEICGYIGTISIEYGKVKIEPNYTTPTLVALLGHLKDMVNHCCKSVAIETTSQGLHQGRLDVINFDAAIFTNLTYDHLDYHRNMENYFQAKKILFDNLSDGGIAIVNCDDESGRRLIDLLDIKTVTYGIVNDATYQAKDIQLFKDKTVFTLKCFNEEHLVETKLVSRFNVYNVLAALAYAHQAGYNLKEVISLLNKIEPIEGRMQKITENLNFEVIIDYAHTPDGYVKFFDYIKSVSAKDKRIITVFGAPGNRDKDKRSMLAQIADQNSDLIILTEEDPRDEDPNEIAKDMQQYIVDSKSIIVTDRYDAINQAIMLANEGDTVCILGKGFEKFIERQSGREFWMGDDEAVKEVINENKAE